MSKDLRLLALLLALFIGQFIVILSLYSKLQTALKKVEPYKQYDVNNPKLDSLKHKTIELQHSLDSLQLVKAKVDYRYIDKINYIYEIKDNSASMDSLATHVLYKLDSLERAGYFSTPTH
jgi:hypothetical protein